VRTLAFAALVASCAASPPPAEAPLPRAQYRPMTPVAFEAERIGGQAPRPPHVNRSADAADIHGAYAVYVERDGHVSHVDVAIQMPGGDDGVVAAIKTWTFKPQAAPMRSLITLIFTLPPGGGP
jgi:hypothetical protein